MIGSNKNLKAIIDFLDMQAEDYSKATTPKRRNEIQNWTRIYMDDVDDDIYSRLNDFSATGLFAAGHSFDQDMAITQMRLRNMMENTDE